MKRRSFVQSLVVAPAVPAAVTAQQIPPQQQQQPTPQPNTPARQVPRQPAGIPKLDVTQPDLAAETYQQYFTPTQFSVLQKLGNILMPPINGYPGAEEAKAPEFLDFLLSVSLPERQKIYRDGLDHLDKQANAKFHKPFSELSNTDVDAILRPLLVVRPWPEDLPSDPMQSFIAQVHEDLRNATMNSCEWADVASKSGHRFTRGLRGSGMYWAPVDPISEG